jgi:hypothetical protein
MNVRLQQLDTQHVEEICKLLQLEQETVQGYLAEEVFGWSMSRVVLLGESGIAGLIQVSKLNPQDGHGLLGTWLVPEVWGTGVNTLAKQMIVRELFAAHPEIICVYLCIDASNVRSIMAARKLPYADEIAEAAVPVQLVSDLARSIGSTGRYWFVIRQGEV